MEPLWASLLSAATGWKITLPEVSIVGGMITASCAAISFKPQPWISDPPLAVEVSVPLPTYSDDMMKNIREGYDEALNQLAARVQAVCK